MNTGFTLQMRQPWAVVTLAQEAFKMTADRRGGGRRSKMARKVGGINQLPWQNVNNTYAPMQLLDEERMEALHRSSMRILSELGIRVMSKRVMSLFEKAGATVDRESQTIRIDETLVMEALKTAPSSFTLTSRNPEKQRHVGGNTLTFGLVAGPPNVHDRINGRRQGNLADYREFHPAGAPFQRHTHARQSGLRSPRTAGQFAPSRYLQRQSDAE